jgi:hypothetical protein
MEKLEIIQCKDKKVLLDYIKKNSSIQVFEQMDINLLKNIALNIPIVPQFQQPQPQQKQQQSRKNE